MNAGIVEKVKVITECGVASGIPAKMIWTQHSFRKVAFIIQAVFFLSNSRNYWIRIFLSLGRLWLPAKLTLWNGEPVLSR